MKAYIIYENEDWLPPLIRELDKAGVSYEKWFLHHDAIDLSKAPPEGVFLNRISPSSHTRGHLQSIHFNRAVLRWLESYGRRVINGSETYELELSKVHQYTALQSFGLKVPKTIAVSGGAEELKKAAKTFGGPFITKHNCGGKGLGVQLFQDYAAFEQQVDVVVQDQPIDLIYLLQEYIVSPKKQITRVEIVNGEFQYAINSDTSRGFELCPAESCEIGTAFCPVGEEETSANANRQSLFSLRENFQDPIVEQYIAFLKHHNVDVAGIEFIEDTDGNQITYDINCTTNYSPGVEEQHGLNGMAAIVKLVQAELGRL